MNPRNNREKTSKANKNALTMLAISKTIQSAPVKPAARADRHRAAVDAVPNN